MEPAAESVRVLHVDDDPNQAELVASSLEREDERFDVETATSAGEGLARLADAAVDCIVSEYDMPDRNGIEFLEAVRQDRPDLPFILYTGEGSEAVASDAIAAGVTDYLQKGGGTSQYAVLANRIRNAVGKHRVRAELVDGERRLELFFEESPLGAIEWTEELTVRRVNTTATDVLGYSEEEIVGASWETLVPESVEAVDSELLAERDGTHSVTETVRKDGERIVCEWHDRVVTDDDGEVVAVFSKFRDVTDRRRRTRQLEALIDNLPGMVYRCRNEPGWPMERVRGNVTDLTGYAASAIESQDGLYGTEIIHHEDRGDVWSAVQDALDAGEPFEITYRIVTNDGDTRWVWERGQGIDREQPGDGDESVAVIEGFVTDITAHRETARELRAEREFIDQALDALDDVFYVVGVDGELQRWNARAAELTGYAVDELDGMDAVELFPPDERTRIREEFDDALRTETAAFEADLHTVDGERVPHEFTAVRLTDADGRPEGLVGVGRDVTERKRYERRLTALHDVAVDLTSIESVKRVCERTVAASREILAFDLSLMTIEGGGVLTPVAVSEEIPADGLTEMSIEEGIAGKTYRTGESFLIDDVQTHPDANPQGPYRSVISLPIGDHGNFQAVAEAAGAFDESDLELAELLVAHAESALDRLARERALAAQNEQLNEFAKVVSHDLRNPLNVVQGRLELAQEECDSEHLDLAADAVERSFALIDDVLTLAREGERVSNVELVDLEAAARECWANVETADATLVVEAEGTIRADASQLTHVLENLFRNAVEHGGEDVTVTVGRVDDAFFVADDGPGVPAARRETVFEAGYSTTDAGTGFGLNIVREIAEAHGWQIRVGESAEGGARFEFAGVDE